MRNLSNFDRADHEQQTRAADHEKQTARNQGSHQMSAIAFGTQIAQPRLRQPRLRQPRLRITRRGRAVLTLLIAVPLAIGAAVAGVGALGAAAGTHSTTTTFSYVTVEPGESLWQLAQAVAPTADPRDVIAGILNLNDLSSGEVQPGQRLAIPAQYASSNGR